MMPKTYIKFKSKIKNNMIQIEVPLKFSDYNSAHKMFEILVQLTDQELIIYRQGKEFWINLLENIGGQLDNND